MIRRAALAAGLLTGCLSGINDNDDGIASIEIRLPANFFLEQDRPLTIRAVARSAAGDSVDASFRWRSPDSTVTVDSTLGIITAVADTGKARLQVALFGKDSLISVLDSLTFTLTAQADSVYVSSADSLEAPFDTSATTIAATVEGGTPRAPVAFRPITFSIVDPVPADTPVVVFPTNRAVDSVTTSVSGIASIVLRGKLGKTIPDRVVVEVNAYRASGEKIPGSGHQVVVRFRHQTP